MKNEQSDWELRPWGKHRVVYKSDGFFVKHLVVNPLCQTSLQRHKNRSEIWSVVKGVCVAHRYDKDEVCFDETVRRVGTSIFIPQGRWHQILNPDDKNILEIIEVWKNETKLPDEEALREDDIERK